MVPFDRQMPTVIRPNEITPDVTYEPPLRVGFGLNDQTVAEAGATMGRTILEPGAGHNPTYEHAANDVCWYILYGRIQVWFARSNGCDRTDLILEGGDFVYIPSGAIHVIANASATEEASLIFCYIGEALRGLVVGLVEVDDAQYDLYFGDLCLGRLAREGTLRPAVGIPPTALSPPSLRHSAGRAARSGG